MVESGNVIWPSQSEPLWRFNWRLADSPDGEGTVITDAYFRGFKLFHKASLPLIRVQYDGNVCGPYKDPLNYNNSRTTSRCPSNRVCIHSYVSGGLRGLNVDSYHTGNPGLGNYRLTHRWVFWETGHVYAFLYSAGLQCNANHRHHAYWRFDFDIEQSINNLALEYNTYAPDVGWGRGWEPITRESSRLKYPPSSRSWAVLNKSSNRGCHIYPGPNDGVADIFSTRDVWLIRYHPDEDTSGRLGSPYNDGLNNYLNNNEDMDGQDIVVWYCGHLYHIASHGGDEWHSVGPTLLPFSY
jgi:Copper amine oxidase, enzyme domain